jgi:hypothetical protein
MVHRHTIPVLVLLAGLLGSIAGCSTFSDPALDPSVDQSGTASVLAIGDSLMVGATAELIDAHPGITIDAKEGRSFSTGIDILEKRLATDTPDVVVFALGTNNGATADQIEAVMDLATAIDEVIFVNVVVPRVWQSGTNLAMLEASATYDNVSFVDWHAAAAGTSAFFRSDGYHLSSIGIERWVDLIVGAAGRR